MVWFEQQPIRFMRRVKNHRFLKMTLGTFSRCERLPIARRGRTEFDFKLLQWLSDLARLFILTIVRFDCQSRSRSMQ
jgi:hypothetical protein